MAVTRSRNRSSSDLSESVEQGSIDDTPTKKNTTKKKTTTPEKRRVGKKTETQDESNHHQFETPQKTKAMNSVSTTSTENTDPTTEQSEGSATSKELDNKSKNNKDNNKDEKEQITSPSVPELTETEKKVKKLVKKSEKPIKKEKNELTKLIPGYTAPLKLNTSSLDRFRPAGGIRELQRRAERTDRSTKSFVPEATISRIDGLVQKKKSGLPTATTSYMQAYSSFKKGTKRAPDHSAGKGWFNMNPTPMSDDLKADIAVVKNRTYLDPKKFYKSADKTHGVVQLGTVIEGAAEYYSSRLTKKQRRTNITEEIMADKQVADYAVNKFKTMSREKTAAAQKRNRKSKRGNRKFY